MARPQTDAGISAKDMRDDMQLDRVVPWGRNLDEYTRMFALTEQDLARPILGCGDGPASFNAEVTERAGRVISCDPIYQFPAEDIEQRIAATYKIVLTQTEVRKDRFIWKEIPSVEALGQRRMAAMRRFLADYDAGRADGRYVAAELPSLPFADGAFDLAVCSHLLFLYTEQPVLRSARPIGPGTRPGGPRDPDLPVAGSGKSTVRTRRGGPAGGGGGRLARLHRPGTLRISEGRPRDDEDSPRIGYIVRLSVVLSPWSVAAAGIRTNIVAFAGGRGPFPTYLRRCPFGSYCAWHFG